MAAEEQPVDHVQRKLKRTNLTRVAFICDKPEYQLLMPQIIVGNHSTFLRGDLETLRHGAPPNVVLLRQKSAWNHTALMRRIIRGLAIVMEEDVPGHSNSSDGRGTMPSGSGDPWRGEAAQHRCDHYPREAHVAPAAM
jgi:hypothetical protein